MLGWLHRPPCANQSKNDCCSVDGVSVGVGFPSSSDLFVSGVCRQRLDDAGIDANDRSTPFRRAESEPAALGHHVWFSSTTTDCPGADRCPDPG